jgi:hypothetical protein
MSTPSGDLEHDQKVPTSTVSQAVQREHEHCQSYTRILNTDILYLISLNSILLVNFSDADITILSSDHVTFKLHRKYLEANTGAFPSAEFETHGEIVPLTEPSNTLEVMFQFVYPKRHPKLDQQDFSSVLAIAEAVEKYEVFSAMNTCETRIM